MQTAKSLAANSALAPSFAKEAPAPSLSRVAAHSAAAAARRAKRVAALTVLAPQLETLSADSKEAGLGLIGYFLDMALYEVKREQELFAQNT